MSNVGPFSSEHGLTYFAFSGVDFREGIGSDDRDAIEKAIRSSPDLSPLYQTETAAIYKFH